jgi:hypothetical protein
MAELSFGCVGARAEPFAATPTLTLRLRVGETTGAQVHAALIRCQIRLEPRRRGYAAQEVDRLGDLFGEESRWADTLQPIQLTTVTTTLPGFSGGVDVDLPVPCSYDLEVASTKYLRAMDTGEVPLLLLFSGTVFLATPEGYRIEQVPWSAETRFGLPVAVWRDTVERYFPHSAWLRIDLDTLAALRRFKSAHALPTWDATLAALLDRSGAIREPEQECLQ